MRNGGAVVLVLLSLVLLCAVGAGLHSLVAELLGERVIGRSIVGAPSWAVPGPGWGVPIVVVPWMVWSGDVGILLTAPVWTIVVVFRRAVAPSAGAVEGHLRPSWEAFGAVGGPPDLDAGDLRRVGRLWNLQWLLRIAGGLLVAAVVGGGVTLSLVVAP